MLFDGVHRTTYAYSAPVFLEPHVLRLRPRSDPRQTVHAFAIDIDPAPDGTTHGIDAAGNDVSWAWFSGTHQRLDITTTFAVETSRGNPFDFIVHGPDSLPPAYTPDELDTLAPYLRIRSGPEVGALAREVAEGAGDGLVAFLRALTSRIYETHEVVIRPEEGTLSADETLMHRQGSCRDLSDLYVEACRHVGVAARFVSGYQEGDPDQHQRELHAWAGVYAPGGGWRGFDPTHGLAVAEAHITLAVGPTPAAAAPAAGSFRGSATASMRFDIQLSPRA